MPDVQSPSGVTTTDPAVTAAAAATAATPPDSERFELPDLCTPVAVFAVVLACQGLATLLALARQTSWPNFYNHLAQVSLLLLWVGLLSAAALCQLRPWLRRFRQLDGSVLTFLVVLGVVLLVSEVSYWLGRYLGAGPDTGAGWFPREHWPFISTNLAMAALVMAPVLRYFYITVQWQRNVERQGASRLVALQARIRPHFLFNSMNTIASLTRSNPPAAEQAVEDLADLFRASLSESRQSIPLRDELEIAEVYLRMEKHRLGDRLQVEWQLGDIPRNAMLPSLTLQPLLENAIYHGIEPALAPGIIAVMGSVEGRVARLRISNPLPAGGDSSRAGHQMALDNIRERLALAYGDAASLTTIRDDHGFTATLTFPCNGPAES
jgi:two-component system, LytTR family, sensor histidine kinase AlgZ